MKKRVNILVLLMVLGLTVYGCAPKSKPEETITKKVETITVEVEEIDQGDIELTTYAIGQLSPKATYNVTPISPGEVIKANFEVGDRVQKDDILFILDQEDFEESKENQLNQLQISLNQAELTMKSAKDTYMDNQKLYEAGSLSKAQLEGSKNQYDQAVLQYRNVLSQIESTKDSLKTQEDNLVITSPVDGIVANKTIEKDMYATNQNGYTIIQNDPIIFKAGIVEKYINKIEVGQKTSVYINALDQTVKGTVKSIALMKEGTTYPVEIEINNSKLNIKPGMFAEVNINYDIIREATVVPTRAVLKKNGEEYIYILDQMTDEGYKVKKVYVEILNRKDAIVQIKDTSLEGEKIITKGSEFIDQESIVILADK